MSSSLAGRNHCKNLGNDDTLAECGGTRDKEKGFEGEEAVV